MFRGRSTLVYLVVALGLVCYLTFIDKKIPGTRERADAETQLFKFDQQDVTGLDVTNPNGSFVFVKKGDHWEIVSPVRTIADTATVMEIISQISFAQSQNTIPMSGSDDANAKNLREWGLSPAAEKAVIHFPNKSLQLLIGRKVAINASVFARTSEKKDAPVRVIPQSVKDALDKHLSDFRSRSVFDFDATKVTRVATSVANTATTPQEDNELDFQGGKWTMQKPLVARASPESAQALLDKILALRVSDFVTDDPGNTSKYGLATPTSTISVTVGPDDDGVLQIGTAVPGKAGQVYAQRLKSNAIFTLEQNAVTEILNAIPNARDRHVLPFDAGGVGALSFDIGAPKPAKASLQRDRTGVWQVVGPSAGAADLGKVSDLLQRLSTLQSTPAIKDSAPDPKPFGLDKPTGKITVNSPGNKAPLTLTLGKTEGNLLYVRNSIEPFIYTVPAGTFAFLGDNLSYRDKRVINLIAARVKSLTITAQGKPPLILDRSPGGTWTAENIKDRAIDATKTDAQASVLCDLQAQAWLGAPKPEYGLDKPVLTFAIQADKPGETVLKIGAPLPDGSRAAQVQGTPDAFSMSEGDYALLNSSTLQLVPGISTNTASATSSPPSSTATNSAPTTLASHSAEEPPKKKKKKAGQ